MHSAVERIIFTEDEIRAKLDLLAKKLMEEYARDGLVVVILLKGALVFAADICRRLPILMTVECINIASYHGEMQSSGEIDFLDQNLPNVEGKSVLVMDDILDTGLTMSKVIKALQDNGANEVRSCVLLNKNKVRSVEIEADFKAFDIADEFIVGYGLDYQGRYRNLPYVGVMKQTDYPAE